LNSNPGKTGEALGIPGFNGESQLLGTGQNIADGTPNSERRSGMKLVNRYLSAARTQQP